MRESLRVRWYYDRRVTLRPPPRAPGPAPTASQATSIARRPRAPARDRAAGSTLASVREIESLLRERALERAMQVEPRLFPVALNGALGHAANIGDLGDRESAKVLEIDELREVGVDDGKLVERVA